MTPPAGRLVHASCVVCNNKGILIQGASGSGKSGLSLQLLALGADLVADDQVSLTLTNGQVVARCPVTIAGRIEARYFGLLQTEAVESTNIDLIVDMEKKPGSRLPVSQTTSLEGVKLLLIPGKDVPNLAQALFVLTRRLEKGA